MIAGVVKEIKVHEYRVALTPAGARALVAQKHEVLVETGAGEGSGLSDADYEAAGARIVPDAATVWKDCALVFKVKEPQPSEWPHMRPGQTLFTYFHLAADEKLTVACRDTGTHCIAYETLKVEGQGLPLLTPMSEVAGRLSIQAGAHWLERVRGGSGALLGGVPGVPPARVMVIGGGVVGTQAARMACGLGADVVILDRNIDRLRELDDIMPANCSTLYSSELAIEQELTRADLVVGAVLIPGAEAPKLVRREHLKLMRPGSVLVDVAVDQGGCFETTEPTTHKDPVFQVDGIQHYCVANMPGAVPRTSTFALTNATLPYAIQLANKGTKKALQDSEPLRHAANCLAGKLCIEEVAEAFGMECSDVDTLIDSL